MADKGILVSGQFGALVARQQPGEQFELGELLVAGKDPRIILQVIDLAYGSQLNQQHLELVSGMQLDDPSITLLDAEQRQYVLATLKTLLRVDGDQGSSAKVLPKHFARVRQITASDVPFLSHKTDRSLHLGDLRSGSRKLDVPVYIDARKALSHHLLISGTTGRGKSVLMKNILWEATANAHSAMLVLDPHDEYWGRNSVGLKDHPTANAQYYSLTPPPGAGTLKINLKVLKPRHFSAVSQWSDPQRDCMRAYFNAYRDEWIINLLLGRELEHSKFAEGTVAVVKRRFLSMLALRIETDRLVGRGVFDPIAGSTTVSDIQRSLENGKTVVIDTSSFSGSVELLIASVLAEKALSSYRKKSTEELAQVPIINIVLEEAPRVIGKDVLERGPNIFSTIAREGRKFGVGLTAITQLPSLIPRQVLANLNTKIILGTELKPERQALIESASQDLSDDSRNIASLDKGEAIVTSNFLRFATPLKIPFFDKQAKTASAPRDFGGFQ